MNRVNDNPGSETRKRVHDFIVENPGTHLREIGRRLGMSMGHLRHHLDFLERSGLIVSKKERYYRRYFAIEFKANGHELLSAVRQRNPRRIVLHLLNNPGATHKEMMAELGFLPSTLSLYLNDLVRKGVVERVKRGKQNEYRVKEEAKVLKAILIYRESFIDRLVNRALEIYRESHK
ncbi:MAG: winged helix-turn-helix transcriptional regulator [Candidatus Geothermarchaeales archaeon]